MIWKLPLDSFILALEKCDGPCRILTWTETMFDTIKMIMYVDLDKIRECLDLADQVAV